MRIRKDFLEWRPDAEPFGNQGLSKAQNVVHDTEGYKPVYLNSAASFATTGGLQSVTSIVCKPVGTQGDLMCAWLSNNTLHIGINGATALNNSTTAAFSTAGSAPAVTSFDVCEYAGNWYVQAEAQQTEAGGTVTSVYAYGYSGITVV
jgi:hypothetical protein